MRLRLALITSAVLLGVACDPASMPDGGTGGSSASGGGSNAAGGGVGGGSNATGGGSNATGGGVGGGSNASGGGVGGGSNATGGGVGGGSNATGGGVGGGSNATGGGVGGGSNATGGGVGGGSNATGGGVGGGSNASGGGVGGGSTASGGGVGGGSGGGVAQCQATEPASCRDVQTRRTCTNGSYVDTPCTLGRLCVADAGVAASCQCVRLGDRRCFNDDVYEYDSCDNRLSLVSDCVLSRGERCITFDDGPRCNLPVTCQTDVNCHSSMYCSNGLCVPDVCNPTPPGNRAFCNGQTVTTCRANGSGYDTVDCDGRDGGRVCVGADDRAVRRLPLPSQHAARL